MKYSVDDLAEQQQRAKDYALKYLSYRPRSVWEVTKKLTDKGYNTEITDITIAFLKEYSFLDDIEFARFWIRNRQKVKPCGSRRIYCELIQKGIPKAIIDKCLDQISPQLEEESAAVLVEKKCQRSSFDYNKIRGFLLRRGYSPEVINKVLAKYIKFN
ncbi:MAG: regulatory protein RecX [Thermincola sp.]|jgi:regulatory protein|nr:regulatory protein RecX [Thermincola sp.]MDT3701646.1 regulatory protein RecX [Thermincola sp.]